MRYAKGWNLTHCCLLRSCLRSATQNKYCGIATPTSNMLCNAASASTNGYKFVWIMEDARNITMP